MQRRLPPVVIPIALALAVGCQPRPLGPRPEQSCDAVAEPLPLTATSARMAGRYPLVLVATSGPLAGSIAPGKLALAPGYRQLRSSSQSRACVTFACTPVGESTADALETRSGVISARRYF